MPLSIVVFGVLIFLSGYLNGQTGSANVVAAMISSRSIQPRLAIWLAAIGMSAGAFLLGSAVAGTVSNGLIMPGAVNLRAITAALIGSLLWNALSLWFHIPVSLTQSLMGALIGATWSAYGGGVIIGDGVLKLLAGLFISPVLGMVGGYFFVQACYRVGAAATPRLNIWFRRGQIILSFLLALVFGSNESQKLMGVMVLGLLAAGLVETTVIPLWVTAFVVVSRFFGTVASGWRLIHTMGGKFYKIRPIHGFGAQAASTAVLLCAGLTGWPVSGSQVVTSAIVGAGSADRLQKVRWMVVRHIAFGWLLTMPLAGLVSAIIYQIMERLAA